MSEWLASLIDNDKIMQRLLKPLVYSILIGVTLYGMMMLVSDFEQIKAALSKIHLQGILIIFGLSLINYLIRFGRWHWYMKELNHHLPAGRHLLYYVSGFALTTTPGKAGEAIRFVYLKKYGVTLSNSIAALFAERFSDLMAMCLLAGLAALHFPDYQSIEIGIALVVGALLVVMQSPKTIDALHRLLKHVTFAKFHSLMEKLFGMIHSSASLLKSWTLIGGLMMSLLSWGAEGVAFYYILQLLDICVSLWLGISIYAISVLIGAISFIPGGLGSTEAVMGLLVIAVGASSGDAIAATVICRVATLWFAVALGFFVMIWMEAKEPRLANINF